MAGRRTHINNVGEKFAGLTIQSSALGNPIALGWGRAKLSCNLLDYLNFTPIPHTTTTTTGGGKGGGGKTTTTETTYTYTADVMLAICEGPITGINAVWKDAAKFTGPTAISQAGLNIAAGQTTQGPWAYLSSVAPSHALYYRTIAYAYQQAYDLGSNAVVANHAFEVDFAVQYNPAGGIIDANPRDILTDFLTNAYHGIPSWPASVNANWDNWANYCTANGLFLSPTIENPTTGQDFVTRLLDITHSDGFFSEGVFKIVPLGDASVTGNGTTWTPDLTPQYDLTEDDFIGEVTMEIADQSNSANYVQIKFQDRANEYEDAVAAAHDLDDIVSYGRRQQDPQDYAEIKDAQVARNVAQLWLQRNLYIRDKYNFTLPMDFIGLEPRDYVTLTTTVDGMKLNRQLVSILEISEDEAGQDALHFIAEGIPGHTASHALYASHTATSFGPDVNADPGNVATPLVFMAPDSMVSSVTGLEVWAAVAGTNSNWGGAFVWISFDNTNYTRVGQITAPARYGTLSATLASHADPDSTNTLSVDLTTSRGSLGSVTTTAADLNATACYVDGEVISFGTATLTSAYHYNLTYLRRGQFGTTIGSHASGHNFARLDSAIFSIPFDSAKLGQTVYIKFQSYNVYGRALQDISTLTATTITLAHNAALPDSSTGSGLALATGGSTWTGGAINVVCNAVDRATNYAFKFYKADGTTLLRTINSVTPNASYLSATASVDGAQREYKISVTVSNAAGALPESAQIDVTNAAPAALSSPAASAPDAYTGQVTATASGDSDLGGYIVWYSGTSGFDPKTAGVIVKSGTLPIKIYGLAAGTYYAKIAAFDPWSTYPDLLNKSAELSFTITTGGGGIASGGGSTGGAGGGDGGGRYYDDGPGITL